MDNNPDFYLYNMENGKIRFGTNDALRMMISQSGGVIMGGGLNEGVTEPFFVETGGTIRRTGASNRTFTQRVVTSTTRDTHIRSRNVSFDAIALRPYARYYPFFDGTSGIDIIPKLLEIDMVNGIFEPGETIKVVDSTGKTTATLDESSTPKLGYASSLCIHFCFGPYEIGTLMN